MSSLCICPAPAPPLSVSLTSDYFQIPCLIAIRRRARRNGQARPAPIRHEFCVRSFLANPNLLKILSPALNVLQTEWHASKTLFTPQNSNAKMIIFETSEAPRL